MATHADHINAWLVGIGGGVIPATIPEDVLNEYGEISKQVLKNQITKAARPAEKRTNKKLYFSEIGGGCFRKVWYRHNLPEHGKVLMPNERIKFMYGDVTEALILALARASGLPVANFQAEASIPLKDGWELRGRIDCTIGDELVDVKSTTTQGFAKFKDGTLADNDAFGYLWQLGGYAAALGYKKASFLAFDKQLGHLVSMPIDDIPSKEVVIAYAEGLIDLVQGPEPAPSTRLDPVPEGKSGNMRLCTTCSYCPHNEVCWRDANKGEGLHTYLYSTGPKFLTEVKEVPRVLRIKGPTA